MRTLLSVIVTALAVFLSLIIVPGVFLSGPGIFFQNLDISAQAQQYLSLGFYSLVVALINIFIRPIIKIISLPLTIVTLGLFALVINVAMLYLASILTNMLLSINIYFTSPLSAIVCAVLISIVSAIFNCFVRK